MAKPKTKGHWKKVSCEIAGNGGRQKREMGRLLCFLKSATIFISQYDF